MQSLGALFMKYKKPLITFTTLLLAGIICFACSTPKQSTKEQEKSSDGISEDLPPFIIFEQEETSLDDAPKSTPKQSTNEQEETPFDGFDNIPPIFDVKADQIKIELLDYPKKGTVQISDKNAVKRFVSLVNNAISTSDHKCAETADLTIISNSSSTTISLLPGHYDKYYEFRTKDGKSIFKFDRSKLFSIPEFNSIRSFLLLLEPIHSPEEEDEEGYGEFKEYEK